MLIGDLVNNSEFIFGAPFKVVSYKRLTDEAKTVFDSRKTHDIPPDILRKEIYLVNEIEDDTLQIWYETDDETFDTQFLLTRAYCESNEWEKYADFSKELDKNIDFVTNNLPFNADLDEIKAGIEELFGGVRIAFYFDGNGEHYGRECGSITIDNRCDKSAYMIAGAIAAEVVFNANHIAYLISQGEYAC